MPSSTRVYMSLVAVTLLLLSSKKTGNFLEFLLNFEKEIAGFFFGNIQIYVEYLNRNYKFARVNDLSQNIRFWCFNCSYLDTVCNILSPLKSCFLVFSHLENIFRYKLSGVYTT